MNDILLPSELMEQAEGTAITYMNHAETAIDSRFGDGYAKKHPDLLVGFMTVCAMDYNTNLLAQKIGGIASWVSGITESVAAIRETLDYVASEE